MVLYMEATTTTEAAEALEWCDGCEEEVTSTEWVETHAATWDCPEEGVSLCDDCMGREEAAAEAWAEAQAEDRANGWR